MRINSTRFGELEVDENRIIEFPDSIPGFPESKKFALLHKVIDEEEDKGKVMFYWLQSVDECDISFPVINVLNIMPDYDPEVDDTELDSIGGFDAENSLVYNIVVIPENVKDMRVNLKAPIVINIETRKAKQVVASNDYEIRYPLYSKISQKVGDE